MNNTNTQDNTNKDDDMLPEYDFSQGVRGKHVERIMQLHGVVEAYPDAAQATKYLPPRPPLPAARISVTDLMERGWLFIGDGYRAKNSELSNSGIPFARVQNINSGFDFHDVDHFPVEDLWKVGNKVSQAGDVVFTSKGTVGRFALVSEATQQFVYSPQLCFWRSLNHEEIEPRWLFYWMQSKEFYNQYRSVAGQTDMADYVSLRDQRRMFVTLPPLPEQRAIASILGALDDKIELNQRMNRTLEEMARALFQSWFVDFDPVRAKAEGRETGLPAEIAALFPDRLVESEAQIRPSTWDVGELQDLLVLQRGFDLPSTQRVSGDYPVIAASGPSGTHNEYMVKGPGVTTGRSGVLGKVFFVLEDFWPLNTSLWVKEFRISKPHHAYFLLQTLDFAAFNAGSAVPTLNRNHVHNLHVYLPPAKLVTHFETAVEPLLRHIKSNEQQSASLSSMRDALLPKLISGELRVPEAEALIEEAVA